ncbi:MAG: DUF2262 domain-containing protein [Chloroflexales bacterium]|nr:DUF2262 domain-containing protein [Chloroflexales bacterium]
MSDQRAIQGLWRVMSLVSRGEPVLSATTHYQFDGNRVKAINPARVDGGAWATFELDEAAWPRRFTMTAEGAGRDGVPVQRVDRWLYDLNGDTLRLCWPNVFGRYPDLISDVVHGVWVLVRDAGSPPQTKQSAGKAPIDDAALGRLTWDDNFDLWDATIALPPASNVGVQIDLGTDQDDAAAIVTGRAFVDWLRAHEPEARAYAASLMLDGYNSDWGDDEQLTPAAFAERLTLEEIAVGSDGDATLYYNDGDLFGGHVVIVSLDANRTFTDANIAG